MYVEDKVSHQGPISLQVIPTMTVAQLKEKVEEEFEIPVRVQRWILGKLLASEDTKTLQDHNVNSNGCPMFLYLVAPGEYCYLYNLYLPGGIHTFQN
jgi:RanBP-type and C3HC4-type zinc finger-containing protein 1